MSQEFLDLLPPLVSICKQQTRRPTRNFFAGSAIAESIFLEHSGWIVLKYITFMLFSFFISLLVEISWKLAISFVELLTLYRISIFNAIHSRHFHLLERSNVILVLILPWNLLILGSVFSGFVYHYNAPKPHCYRLSSLLIWVAPV